MKIGHILRKYNPKEWAGTETVLRSMISELNQLDSPSAIYCPKIMDNEDGPFEKMGVEVHRFDSFLPVWNLTKEQERRQVAIGGNLMSLNLAKQLFKGDLSVIHTHTLGLLGAIGYFVAKRKKIPFIVSIHGGAMDLPKESSKKLQEPLKQGWRWGKLFSLFLRPDLLLKRADAILTFNKNEASLLKKKFPNQNVILIPHGINPAPFEKKHSCVEFAGKEYALIVARIDPVKNQLWAIDQLPELRKRHPNLELVFAGPCTDQNYLDEIRKRAKELNVEKYIHYLGAFEAEDPKLIGLMQHAKFTLLPSIAEPFGMVILESWAAGTPVLSSRSSGPLDLINQGKNGWLFDLEQPESFHKAVDEVLNNDQKSLIEEGKREVREKYNIRVITRQIYEIYQKLQKNLQ